MNESEILELFRRIVRDEGGTTQWAKAHKVSRQYVADVLTQKRGPGPTILHACGVTKETIYRKGEE